MSLVCHECNHSLGPSTELPGREGTLMYPVLQAMAYIPQEKGNKLSFKLVYQKTEANRSLCFNCIEKALPKTKRKATMLPIYNCFEAEMARIEAEKATAENAQRVRREHPGAIIVSTPVLQREEGRTLTRWLELSKTLPTECIICNQSPENGSPYFTARVIDRVHGSQHTSGLFGETNYSFTNLETCSTRFNICLKDFRKHFPASFRDLSYDLTGDRNPAPQRRINELYLSKEVSDELEKTGGLDSFIDEMTRVGGNIRIIRPE